MKEVKKILYKNLIGVNKAALQSHHDFEKSVIKAMQDYSNQEKEQLERQRDELLTAAERVLRGQLNSGRKLKQAIENAKTK